MQRIKKRPSPIADATFCGSERWWFSSWSKAPLPHDLRRPLLCIGRVDADNWENTNTNMNMNSKEQLQKSNICICHVDGPIVQGYQWWWCGTLHLLFLHQLHLHRYDHLLAISTLLRRTRLTYNCAHLRSTKESLTDSVKKFFVRKFFCVKIFLGENLLGEHFLSEHFFLGEHFF